MNIPPNKKYTVYVNLQGNLDFKFGLFSSLDKEPVDSEAISKSRKTTERLQIISIIVTLMIYCPN